jgi:class 3 adenylate cyclase
MKRRALANLSAGMGPATERSGGSPSESDAEPETPRSLQEQNDSTSSYENADEGTVDTFEESDDAEPTQSESRKPNESGGEDASEPLADRHERLQELFDCFVPPEYQELISPSGIEQLQLGEAVCRSLTIMFTDIRDFATMSERMYIDELLDFLHAYFAFALPAIDQNGGFVDKFIGDAVMAVFAHNDLHQQARAAVKAAIGMLHNLELMTAYGFPISNTGIGINTGRTIVGLLGTETRLEPTSIGDAVNLAARTEAACKQYGAKLIITEYTLEKLGSDQDSYRIRELDHVAVKGKDKACRLYEVLDGEPDEGVRAMKTELLDSGDWPNALKFYSEGNFEEALKAFESCLNRYPADVASALFVDRCKQLIQNNVDRQTWDGVYKLRSK